MRTHPLPKVIGEDLSRLEAQVAWWNGAKHDRRLALSPQAGCLRIHDTWDGPEPPVIRFCLDPALSPELSGGLCVIRAENARLTLENDLAPIEIERAEVSTRCYHVRPTHRVCIRPRSPGGETVTIVTWEFK